MTGWHNSIQHLGLPITYLKKSQSLESDVSLLVIQKYFMTVSHFHIFGLNEVRRYWNVWLDEVHRYWNIWFQVLGFLKVCMTLKNSETRGVKRELHNSLEPMLQHWFQTVLKLSFKSTSSSVFLTSFPYCVPYKNILSYCTYYTV